MNEIKFYKVNEPYGFFSNFSPHPIFVDGEVWQTVEHFFQASKFEDVEIINKIKVLDSPMTAAIEGRNRSNKIKSNWDDVKEKIMFKALMAKFLQHPNLKNELLNTADSILIEHTINDNYWGNNGDNTGKNRLGILLMEIREAIRNLSKNKGEVLPPWISFPNISQYDMFWRMGLGEEYLLKWYKYYLTTNSKIYQEKFPEDIEWKGIYD